MPFFSLLAAASLAAPGYSIKLNDYPDKALEMGKSAAILADVVVDPKGKLVRCEKLDTFGDAELADEICKIYETKRHEPAHFANGEPAWFMERDVYRMFIPGTPTRTAIDTLRKPDAILEVNALPPGMETLDALVVIAIDEAGEVTDCGPDVGDEPSPVIQAVCANADVVPHDVFTTPDGNAAPYVSRMRFRLQVAAAPSDVAS
ncbi:hypothetical protein [Novosphingobium sp. PC22D]|uniref:hypothetical protein n=1 Tax=Novosphingobium sp. PC22D TaxID=1962403 RepID=UPI001145482A|nr:hypothetical protein [Novosphingobium sp. PC22D]